MNSDDHRLVTPPAWADTLLRLLLPPATRESVSGDLIEEYRDAVVPARGPAADRWYLRQVSGFVWRACRLPGVLVAGILLVRLVFDAWAPVTYTRGVVHPRSAIMSWMLMATFAAAACCQTWRTRHLRTGVLVALATALIGGALSTAGALMFVGIWHDAQTLRAIQASGGLDEAVWGVPVLLLPIGLATGTAGALLGKALTWPLKRSGQHA